MADLRETASDPQRDFMQATPREPISGFLSDLTASLYSPERTQTLQGIARFFDVPELSRTLNRYSYGQPITNIGKANVPLIPDDTAAAAMFVAPLAAQATRFGAKAGRLGVKVIGQEIADRVATGQSLLPKQFAEPKSSLFAVEPSPMMPKPQAPVSELGFYSAAEQAAMNLERSKGTGQSFLNDLMNAPDVKKDELSWIGLDDFLKDKPNVTKQEVQDFIASNKVDLQEVRLGESFTEDPVGVSKRLAIFEKYEPEIQALYKEMDNPRYRLVNRGMSAEEYNRGVVLQNRGYRGESLTAQEQSELDNILSRLDGNTVQEFANAEEARSVYLSMNPEERLQHSIRPVKSSTELQQEINLLQVRRDAEADRAYVIPEPAPTRYKKYQLPGGENYREILLKIPENMSEYNKYTESLRAKYGQGGFANLPLTDIERARLDKFYASEDVRPYQSSHFNDPNILAHIRVNDRVDADGKKMLLVEELQSDWHQAGREQGYQNPKLQAQAQEKITALKEEHKRLGKVKDLTTNQEERNAIAQQRFDLMNQIFETSKLGSTGVPDAPFKDNWYQLSLKRILKYAADNGYDRVGLTTGKRQVERFSDELRQNVDEINFNPIGTQNEIIVNAKKDGQNTFSGTIKDGKFIDGQAKGKTVEEVLGKTMAKQIAEKKDGVIKGDNLTVGGEGMKKYYDEIYPKFLEKYGKKWDASVGETRIKTGRGVEGGEPVRYIDITPKMKERVSKGQPLFSAAPAGTLGLSGLEYTDPFGNLFPQQQSKPQQSAQPIAVKPKTWDAAAAQRAKMLEDIGTDPKTIWQQTGTWKGTDGKWRQEVMR